MSDHRFAQVDCTISGMCGLLGRCQGFIMELLANAIIVNIISLSCNMTIYKHTPHI